MEAEMNALNINNSNFGAVTDECTPSYPKSLKDLKHSAANELKSTISEESNSDPGRTQSNEDESVAGGGRYGKLSNGRKKAKVDWTPELHRKFVEAVEFLGVEKAIPSRILELMDVQCLTRHNVASHLQKYRTHHRHLLAREAESVSWPLRKESSSILSSSSGHPPIQPRPIMGHPSYPAPFPPPNAPMPPGQSLSPAIGTPIYAWGHPSQPMDQVQAQMWQHSVQNQLPVAPPPSPWYDSEGWRYPGSSAVPHMEPWGLQHLPAVQGTPWYPQMPKMACGLPAMSHSSDESSGYALGLDVQSLSYNGPRESYDEYGFHADAKADCFSDDLTFNMEDFLNEALTNPETIPPIGLKLSAVDSVLSELEMHEMARNAENIAGAPTACSIPAGAASSVAEGALLSCLTEQVKDLPELQL